MNIINKYGKKKVAITSLLALGGLIAIGLTTNVVLANNEAEARLQALTVAFDDTKKVIEYGTKFDTKDLVKSTTGTIKAYPTLDTKKIGDATLTYNVCSDDICKDLTFIVTIKDTKAPVITLKADSIDLTVGDVFDNNSNITSVVDTVDGAIKDYKVDGTVDTSKEGTYDIKVNATDINKLTASKSFKVNVKPKPVEPVVAPAPKPSKPVASNNTGNTGSSSNTDTSKILCPGSMHPELPCGTLSAGLGEEPVGNSGKVFLDKDEAWIWAGHELEFGKKWWEDGYRGFWVNGIEKNTENVICNLVYTVDFYK
ncbi:MAG: hypothetical protein RSD85_01580 [Erysipelotrichaceae bacterium]